MTEGIEATWPTDVWAEQDPDAAGFDAERLAGAVAFAEASESAWPRSLYYPDGRYVGIVEWNEHGPWSDIAGPVRPRGGPAGVILKGGTHASAAQRRRSLAIRKPT